MTITISCPSCTKETFSFDELCSRCGSDLGMLFQIKLQSKIAKKQAVHDFQKKRYIDCLQNCEQSWHCFPTVKTAELAIVAAVLSGDAFLVMRWKSRSDRDWDLIPDSVI